MKLWKWIRREKDVQDKLQEKDMNSSQKKIRTAEEIIEMMEQFKVDRRSVHIQFNGSERRRA